MSDRLIKLNHLISVEVSKILKNEVELNGETFITVVGTDISPTLEHATVRISVFPETERGAVLKLIKSKIYFLQQLLNKRLVMRPVPKIRFEIDRTEEGAAHVEELIEKNSKS